MSQSIEPGKQRFAAGCEIVRHPPILKRRQQASHLGTRLDAAPHQILAPDRQAFVYEKERIVSHGGISVEEMILPLVTLTSRGK